MPQQRHIAEQCRVLLHGFANVGIIALVDEATGYQELRARDALAKILEAFVTKELRKWVKTFPVEYFKELCRLRGVAFPTDKFRLPSYFGHLTNDIIHDRLAPGVRVELHRLTPRDEKGRLKNKLFQRLTEEVGHPKLREHLASSTALMRASDDWDGFYKMLIARCRSTGTFLYLRDWIADATNLKSGGVEPDGERAEARQALPSQTMPRRADS
jgi:hypothetical protein